MREGTRASLSLLRSYPELPHEPSERLGNSIKKLDSIECIRISAADDRRCGVSGAPAQCTARKAKLLCSRSPYSPKQLTHTSGNHHTSAVVVPKVKSRLRR